MKDFWTRKVLMILCLLGVTATPLLAQNQVAFQKTDRTWQIINDTDYPRYPSQVSRVAGARATWNVTYLDVTNNTNVGFDDPALGATRRATVDAVIAYIDSVLMATGTADVEFQNSQTDGSGFLAQAGPFFSVAAGFSSGFAHQHLTTGVDPNGSVPDITSTVDFGFNWNSDTGPPTAGEFDLFSVLLHEISHGLGMISLSDAAGNSGIGANVFSVWDDLMIRNTGPVDLFTAGGVFAGAAGDLISGDLAFSDVATAASHGGNPPIFAPSPFQSGSSLGHWDNSATGTPVMVPAIAAGVSVRTYEFWETRALQALGYAAAVPVDLQQFSID